MSTASYCDHEPPDTGSELTTSVAFILQSHRVIDLAGQSSYVGLGEYPRSCRLRPFLARAKQPMAHVQRVVLTSAWVLTRAKPVWALSLPSLASVGWPIGHCQGRC